MQLEKEIVRYSKINGYAISRYYDLKCLCGSSEFRLYSDDDEGGAYAVCVKCGSEHDIESSKAYMSSVSQNVCSCEYSGLNLGVGKSYFSDIEEPKWTYVGAHCPKCGLSGVYVDWEEL
ncbi:hypothetical protein QTV44_004219 [Vibrio vulnificus]|nr:hypothetical protein [Vibrio vulnificus]